MDRGRGGEGEMYGKSIMETYITICKIANGNLLYGSGNSNRAQYQPRGVGWGGRFKREGIYVYLWLIHFEVLQKTTKFCKAIIRQ